jgi:hypothetical protein
LSVPLDESLDRFRIASRELFNHYFRATDRDARVGWTLAERFSEVEAVLFQKLVTEPFQLPNIRYGEPISAIHVRPTTDRTPIMLNREIDSGYWDFPLETVTREADLAFVRYFDWDQLAYRDNQYVRVRVEAWPSHPEAVGKYALIETQYVEFGKA